ncbi:MAG: D-tyrosyl-tRNA(Tyr) deacylase [Lactobacillales bacterium]|nr:D-tyrosyl-tRNA(Tyr) deacylase [Lactobacillales bacterium]
MKTVIQRVSKAHVDVGGKTVGAIQKGMCLLIGIEASDTMAEIEKMVQKIIHLRIFSDKNGKMNLSLLDIKGAVLAISQFTLLGDCRTGRRPSFTNAGDPENAKRLYDLFTEKMHANGIPTQCGVFGAHMDVHIENDGPVTFILESEKNETKK